MGEERHDDDASQQQCHHRFHARPPRSLLQVSLEILDFFFVLLLVENNSANTTPYSVLISLCSELLSFDESSCFYFYCRCCCNRLRHFCQTEAKGGTRERERDNRDWS